MNNNSTSALTAIALSACAIALLFSGSASANERNQFPDGRQGAGKEHVKHRASGRDKQPSFIPIDDRSRFPGRRRDGGTLNRDQFPKDTGGCSERVCQ